MLETKIAKYGNSLTVRLPSALARELDLHEGDRVTIQRQDQGILIERPGARLAELLATVKEAEAEVSTGRMIGREILD